MSDASDELDTLVAGLGVNVDSVELSPTEKKKRYNRAYMKAYRTVNREEDLARKKEYRDKNKDKLSEYSKLYQSTSPKRKQYIKNYTQTDLYRNRRKSYSLHRNYGLSKEQYTELVKESDGRCCYCGNLFSSIAHKNPMHVDHCHDTGRIRGLACRACNVGIGHFNDDPDLMIKVAEALRKLK